MSRFPLQQTSGRTAVDAAGPHARRLSAKTVLIGSWVAFFLLQLATASLRARDASSLCYYPAALSVALLLLYGPKALPTITLAPLPAALLLQPMGMPTWAIAAVSLLYGCFHALAVLAFRKARLSPRLRRIPDVAGFMLLAMLSPLAASVPILAVLRTAGALPGHPVIDILRMVFLSNALGVLTLTPALLLWAHPFLRLGWHGHPARRAELHPGRLLLQAASLALAAFVVVRFSEPGTLHLKYLLFLPVTWVVVQGGLRAASLAFPLLTVLLAMLILRSDLPADAQLGIQSFLCVLFGTGLFLGAAMDAQREAIRMRDRRSLHLNHLMDATGAIPWEMDLESGRCTYLGQAVESLLGRAPEVWQRKPFWADVIHPDDQLTFLKFLLQVSRNRGVHQIEFKLQDSEGHEHWVRAAGGMEPAKGKGLVMGFLFDIHAHKHAEENALRVMLKEKDILLREIHHRVKNNLQVVSSLLRLQSSTSEDPALQRALKEAQERVQAIALIHQKLKHAPDFSQLDLPGYVRTLAERLVRSYASVPALIDLQVKVAEVDIGPDSPVPLGLILNELVANALQHAFPPGEGGSLDIEIDRDSKGWITLRVADSGQGLPESVHLAQGGLGFQLVQALTDQLGGTLELERRRGAAFLLTFPPTRRP
ncbi:sensor histidine kinase [Geothrix sp. PMB-07]|uniref:sensor histidine kinase n=1 Tax=Geothrix sp. PMB-07 TaxID=3068640 RepID=UPI0027410C3C|nr:histidine kinase dimerization/phosphoacceptor domain -containing protein [Geothrix sp. PMB-07]WLT32625.1 histidine kinase dimerization/phosphoacceptor domain -containing protein [Geothrix sp. PMB-07]